MTGQAALIGICIGLFVGLIVWWAAYAFMDDPYDPRTWILSIWMGFIVGLFGWVLGAAIATVAGV